jgi:hypothetical protein
VRGPGDREPAADLVRPVAGQLDFLIGQIHTLSTSPRSSMEEPPVELLVGVAHPGHTDEVRQAARPDQRDPIQSDIRTDGLAQRDAERVPASGFRSLEGNLGAKCAVYGAPVGDLDESLPVLVG